MGDWFIGEVRLFPYTKAPDGWMECDGRMLPIRSYQALASLLGISYGGDGQTTFALPDLRGRVPVGAGTMPDATRIATGTLVCGKVGGTETVALATSEMPLHSHGFGVNPTNATSPAIANSIPSTVVKPTTASAAAGTPPTVYGPPSTLQGLNAASVSSVGSGTGHENRQPFLPLRYCIATQGLYPPRN